MKKLYILTLFICLAGFGTSFAQTLKGHIYDANTNEPLVGAAVTYKLHGNQGTVSDINGAYEIKLPEGGVDLVFSYIGYFNGHGMSLPVMLQGITASFLVRVPLSYVFSLKEGASLFDIGLAVPLASVYGIVFFTVWYVWYRKRAARKE